MPQTNYYNEAQVIPSYKQTSTKIEVGEAISSGYRIVCSGAVRDFIEVITFEVEFFGKISSTLGRQRGNSMCRGKRMRKHPVVSKSTG